MNKYLPASISPDDVETTIGLISDTHMPQRWKTIPTAVSTIFQNVDFILHAGDVGELWVLDRLSEIAPVFAVHGNDETDDAKRELPEQQIIVVKGQRIMLWHSHYANRVDEMHTRRSDSMLEACYRVVGRGRSAGAELVVFGHWHTPLVFEENGVTIVNPGAIASGNLFRQQMVQTVALLFVLKNGRFHITHINTAAPEQIYEPPTNLEEGFGHNLGIYGRSILSPQLEEIKSRFGPMFYFDHESFLDAFLPLSHQVYEGKLEMIQRENVINAFETADIKESARKEFLNMLRAIQ
ncbi:MAG: metallophosphoesterase family protein [Chloroflexota bacterium]